MIPPRELDQTQSPASDVTSAPPSDAATTPPSSAPSRRERFVAGAMVGSRYRIVAPLGRGGMGEVYRADDLELHQTVAIKFLPERLANDPLALDRLRSEVRIARQIAHPNVCRVYDMGQAGGEYFITMEFVDGEDLASVLRRLGAPSREKSLELARQICAGLSAAHELGVLHRDLKPANIMLDGRGRARITDFGLAGLATDLQSRREHAGTPAYMAPEQLRRGEVSRASDLYSLGLILLELFTGRSPNTGKRIDELLQTRDDADVSGTILSLSDQLDPAIERVIQRCLATNPGNRPASAMAVVAALPGGDPIAAALAAGETPSPQLVAAARDPGLLRIKLAAGLLALALGGLLVHLLTQPRKQLVNQAALPKSTEVLADRGREIVEKLGWKQPPRDRGYGFYTDNAAIQYAARSAGRAQGADAARSLSYSIRFWYRHSPVVLVPRTSSPAIEPVSVTNPPNLVSGMVALDLASDGRLLRFLGIAPRWSDAPTTQPTDTDAAAEKAFATMLGEAGFDPSTLRPEAPLHAPAVACDRRAAWTGTFPDTGLPARIEAGLLNGLPVYFVALPPWEAPDYRAPQTVNLWASFFSLFQVIIFAGTAVLIGVNFTNRRGDTRGALRVAMFVFLFDLLSYLLTEARFNVMFQATFPQFFQAFAFALLRGSLAWALYIGLEPYIRRRSPYRLVSWQRLLEGRVRDPLVGRDVLLGIAAAAGAMLVGGVLTILLAPFFPPPAPVPGAVQVLGETRKVWELISGNVLGAIIGAMIFLILPLILQTVLRSWVATTFAFWLLVAVFVAMSGGDRSVPALLVSAVAWGACLFALYRFGVVAGAAAIFATNLMGSVPIAANWSAWYATPGLLAAGVVAVLACAGFFFALAGRSIFPSEGFLQP